MDDIANHLKTLSFKQLKALAKYTNLHYHISMKSRENVINGLIRLFEYRDGVYGNKPFKMVLTEAGVKVPVSVKRKMKIEDKTEDEAKGEDEDEDEDENKEKYYENLNFDSFKNIGLLRDAISEFYKEEKKIRLVNFSKITKEKLKQFIEKQNIDLNDIRKYYIQRFSRKFGTQKGFVKKFDKMISEIS